MSLLSFIPTGWLAPAAFTCMGLLSLWGAGEHWRANINADETKQCADKATLDAAEQTRAALDAATKYRAHEAELNVKVQNAQADYSKLQADHARAIVASRAALAESGKLRSEIAAYASGSRDPSDNTCASERDRAVALAGLLAEALRVSGEGAADAEANADAVRTLLSAWPK